MHMQLQSTQVYHQATECRVPWNTVGIQTSDDHNTATIISAASSLAGSMPMLMPLFFQQLGTNMLPIVQSPIVDFGPQPAPINTTSSNLQPPQISGSFVDEGTQATESHIQPIPKEIVAARTVDVSKLPIINSRAALGQLEEDSDSDWEEFKRGSNSPSTPSTPVSSPYHKRSLREAMQLFPDINSTLRESASARNDPRSEVCQGGASVFELLCLESISQRKSINNCVSIIYPSRICQILNKFFIVFGTLKGLKHRYHQCLTSIKICIIWKTLYIKCIYYEQFLSNPSVKELKKGTPLAHLYCECT